MLHLQYPRKKPQAHRDFSSACKDKIRRYYSERSGYIIKHCGHAQEYRDLDCEF